MAQYEKKYIIALMCKRYGTATHKPKKSGHVVLFRSCCFVLSRFAGSESHRWYVVVETYEMRNVNFMTIHCGRHDVGEATHKVRGAERTSWEARQPQKLSGNQKSSYTANTAKYALTYWVQSCSKRVYQKWSWCTVSWQTAPSFRHENPQRPTHHHVHKPQVMMPDTSYLIPTNFDHDQLLWQICNQD